jgi:dsDNA-binding SOS-regulon protein
MANGNFNYDFIISTTADLSEVFEKIAPLISKEQKETLTVLVYGNAEKIKSLEPSLSQVNCRILPLPIQQSKFLRT